MTSYKLPVYYFNFFAYDQIHFRTAYCSTIRITVYTCTYVYKTGNLRLRGRRFNGEKIMFYLKSSSDICLDDLKS